MRGHQPLLEMRRSGAVVDAVWFDFDGDWWKTWPRLLGVDWRRFPEAVGSAHVLIEPDDGIARLDLRFVVGLQCWVDGTDQRRVHQLHDACIEAGAQRVLSAVTAPDAWGNHRVVEMLDSAGHFVSA